MNENLFLFASIAGTPIAVRASEIEAVVRLGDIVPVHRVPPHVRGLAALRSRVLTVVDIESRIFGRSMTIEKHPLAVVAEISAHTYGLLVETVSDICEAPGGVVPIQGASIAPGSPLPRLWSNARAAATCCSPSPISSVRRA